jgi:hypothetical protein
MKTALAVFAGVPMILAAAAPAHAQRTEPPPIEIHLGVSLFTPPLPIGPGGAFLGGEFKFPAGSCQVVNVSATALLVSVRIFDIAGTEIGQPGDGSDPLTCTVPQLLQPRTGCAVVTGHDFSVAYCKITVVGAKESVRGSLTDLRSGLDPLTNVSETSRGTVAAQ